MADLTTYEFYTNNFYGDKVSQSDFPKWLSKATDELHYLTNHNIGDSEVVEYSEKIQKAVCSLMDVLFSLDEATKSLADGTNTDNIKSKSSGGESISYGDIKNAYSVAISDSSAKYDLEMEAIKPYLSGTGLLYMGL